MRSFVLTCCCLLGGLLFSQQNSLTSVGPAGGIINHLAGSTDDASILAVVRENKLYRSTDGGESWHSVPVGSSLSPQFTIHEITFHPTFPDTVLMATSGGLYRSADKGATWTLSTAFPSPTHSVQYAPANRSVLFGSDMNGVLRSNDGGKSWVSLKDNVYFGNRSIFRIAIHPGDAANFRVAVSTGFSDTSAIFFTPDGGQQWKQLTKNLPSGSARRIYAMKMDSTGLGMFHFRLLASTAGGVFALQSDQGDTAWQQLKNNTVPISGVITSAAFVYDRYNTVTKEHVFSFYLSSNGSEFDGKPQPYSVNNGLFKIDSKSGSILHPLFPPPVKRIFSETVDITGLFVPVQSNKGKLYLGTTAGVFVSIDSGQTWSAKNKGLNHSIVRNAVSLTAANGTTLTYAPVFGGGVIRSTDHGAEWSRASTGLSSPFVYSLAADHQRNILYAATPYTVYRTTNAGTLWLPMFTVDSAAVVQSRYFTTRKNDMSVRVSPKNPDFILMHSAAFGLRLSKNAGTTWTHIPLPGPIDTVDVPERIAFDPRDSLTIYAAGRGLYVSTNLGGSWRNISGNIPLDRSTINPTVNPRNPAEILLPSFVEGNDTFSASVYRTTDAGVSWEPANVSGVDAVYDPFDDRTIFVTGPDGFFGSTDGGKQWKNFSDSVQQKQYLLIDQHPSDRNRLYAGSESGLHTMQLFAVPALSIDTAQYYFGSLFIGKDSLRPIAVRNTGGTGRLTLRLVSLSDTVSFKYSGPALIDIAPGGSVTIPVRFFSATPGFKSAQFRWETNDPVKPLLSFILSGHSYNTDVFEKFTIDFGSVTVGRDSILPFAVNNTQGIKPVTVSFLGKSGDTAAFHYGGPKSFVIDSGGTTIIPLRFAARVSGERIGYFRFSTSDPRFPTVQYRLKGTGVAKNFLSRRILIDSSIGFVSPSGGTIADHYQILALSLRRADISVHYQKSGAYDGYHSLVFVRPNGAPPPTMIDSLQRYTGNGGTVVIIGDRSVDANAGVNTFFADSGWMTKFNQRTGIRFLSEQIIDTNYSAVGLSGVVTARPVRYSSLTYGVDSLVMYIPSGLFVDSTVTNAEPLFLANSPALFTVTEAGVPVNRIPRSVTAAVSRIGKGKLIAIADHDIWWNGIPDDTTKPLGVFGGKNLQFAFNIFGSIDQLIAQIQQKQQEAYEMLAVPYSFADSSVETLFKDLGKPNKVLWRMFGKYDQRRGYAEFPDNFRTIARGEGYWLITKNKVNMDLGTTSVQSAEDDFQITLHPGYNMIGNPFPYRVSWFDSFKEDSVETMLWSYTNGRYDTVSQTMEPFRGYWVKNRAATNKTIRISSVLVEEVENLSKQPERSMVDEPKEWIASIAVSAPGTSDQRNSIGALWNASDGIDPFDISEPPPAPGKFISLAFHHPEERLSSDIRTVNDDGYVWDAAVSHDLSGIPVTMTVGGNIPDNTNLRLYLIDMKEERIYDVSGGASVTYRTGKGEYMRRFRLIAGNEQFLHKHSNGIPLLPMEYSLSQNYPNPFNPETHIRYSLAHSGRVFIEIFNVLGQKVKILTNDFQPIGSYIVTWNGTDELNRAVSSGIYYYRITVNEFTAVKKMTFIK